MANQLQCQPSDLVVFFFFPSFITTISLLLVQLLLLLSSSSSTEAVSNQNNNNYNNNNQQNSQNNQMRVHKHISAHIQRTLLEIDRLQGLHYGETCDSLIEEKERHDLNDLVAQVIRAPNEDLLAQISTKQQEIILGGKIMCNYTRGLACDPLSSTCTCYTGSRHGDILYEPVRENGTCKLDEMSRCYSPSYLVSRGATVIPCVHGAKCIGELSGRRCISPIFTENCHCQRPCPDGSFSNLSDELRKCIAKLDEISVLQFGDNCSFPDQLNRDEIVGGIERSDRAGPIIRGIKRLLASERLLCSPQDQLICNPDSQLCSCGPEKDSILYARENGSCLWAKGSRCFPEGLYANVTGSNGSCVQGTSCLLQGELIPCDPALDEPSCFCQDPNELESGGIGTTLLILLLIILLVGSVLGFLVHSKKISCPPGSSPANV